MITQKLLNTPLGKAGSKFTRLLNPYTISAVILGALAGALVAFVDQPAYIYFAVIGIVVLLLALYSKEFGLVILIFISYMRFSDVMTEFHNLPSTAKPFLVILIVSILMRWTIFHESPKGWENPTLLFGLLSLAGFASLMYSPVPDRVVHRLNNDLKDMLIAIIVVILLQTGPS